MLDLNALIDSRIQEMLSEDDQKDQQQLAEQTRKEAAENALNVQLRERLGEALGEDFVAALNGGSEIGFGSWNPYSIFKFNYCDQEFRIWQIKDNPGFFLGLPKGESKGGLDESRLKGLMIDRMAKVKYVFDQEQEKQRISREIEQEILNDKAAVRPYRVSRFDLYRWTFSVGDEVITAYTDASTPSSMAIAMIVDDNEDLRYFNLAWCQNLVIEEIPIKSLDDLPYQLVKPRILKWDAIGVYEQIRVQVDRPPVYLCIHHHISH